jgi:hypothetical protein
MKQLKELGKWLIQSQAIVYTGKTATVFMNQIKPQLLQKKERKEKPLFCTEEVI